MTNPPSFIRYDSPGLPRIFHCHLPGAPSTVAALRVSAGFLHDPPDYPGTAHLLEHLLAGRDELTDGFLNNDWHPDQHLLEWRTAETDYVSTTYFHAAEAGHEAALYDRLGDYMRMPVICDLAYHHQCVANERLAHDLGGSVTELLYDNSSMLVTANNLPETPSLMAIGPEHLRHFHDKWYRPQNTAVVVVSPRPWPEDAAGLRQSPRPPPSGRPPQTPMPLIQDGAPLISFRPNQARVRVRVDAVVPARTPLHLTDLLGYAMRLFLLDRMRVTLRLAYWVDVTFYHFGVAQIIDLKTAGSSHFAPTIMEELAIPLRQGDWLDNYWEPAKDALLAQSRLIPKSNPADLVTHALEQLTRTDEPLGPTDYRREMAALPVEAAKAFLEESRQWGHLTIAE
jgi:hypothetical protein